LGTILGGIGVGEAWLGAIVASFDGLESCRFDRESCGSMKVSDEGLCAGQVIGTEGTEGTEGGLLGGGLGRG